MIARLLTMLAVTLPLAAGAAEPAGKPSPAGPSASARDVHEADAGATPASVVPGGAIASAPAAAAQGTPAAAGSARAAAPGASSGVTAGTTVGDSSPGAGVTEDAAPTVAAAPVPAGPPAAPVTMPSGSATGSLLQTLFALIAVLAVLAGLAWFLKRYGPKVSGGTASLRIVSSLSLGGRERLIVVEVGDQWIVVGASPGRVNALATMPRQDVLPVGAEGATLAPHQPAANNFAEWLKQTIDKRK
jgi:flagellar biosynthetic protein FliO